MQVCLKDFTIENLKFFILFLFIKLKCKRNLTNGIVEPLMIVSQGFYYICFINKYFRFCMWLFKKGILIQDINRNPVLKL